EDYGYAKFFDSVDALVLGWRTYETVLQFSAWPYGNKRCVVLTHTSPSSRHGEEFHSGPLGPLLGRLKIEGIRRIYVDGGAVIRAFLAERLIDDLTLSVIPVLLGDGLPLFAAGGPEQGLQLRSSQAFPSGLVQLTYDLERRSQ